MAIEAKTPVVSSEETTDSQAVFEALGTGKPLDPAIARRVRERGQRLRDELRQKFGVLDIGVPAIRELRGDLPQS